MSASEMREERVSTPGPLRALFVLSGAILAMELLIMLILEHCPLESPLTSAVLDAGLLTAVTFPLLYFWVFRPQNESRSRLEAALADVRVLKGLIPICCHCRKIRDDDGFWQGVESYVQTRSEAQFSHSVCPSCLEEHYPEVAASEACSTAADDCVDHASCRLGRTACRWEDRIELLPLRSCVARQVPAAAGDGSRSSPHLRPPAYTETSEPRTPRERRTGSGQGPSRPGKRPWFTRAPWYMFAERCLGEPLSDRPRHWTPTVCAPTTV